MRTVQWIVMSSIVIPTMFKSSDFVWEMREERHFGTECTFLEGFFFFKIVRDDRKQ